MRTQVHQRLPNITDSQLKTIDIILSNKDMVDTLQPTTKFEVVVFFTQIEYDNTWEEKEFKKKIRAKFRAYDEAEKYAQELAMRNIFYRIILRA